MMLEKKPIECPDKPIPDEECIAADREVIAAKREYADALDLVPENGSFTRSSQSRLLRAEARTAEIGLHNQLWRIGRAMRQVVETPLILPQSFPTNGSRQ